ncbi:sugar ABC transporter ATP-binding protein [Rhodococcus sp. NPDC057014]|uniref:sugar ABC transporter ATP-binding protein n=1 Tax=Rhodococcus sp. NPDC057014 TaxID=3346000 RepID=UPI003639E6DD
MTSTSDMDGRPVAKTDPTEMVLRAIGISKKFAGNQALKPTDFELAAGECVAIIGENGAGKSTFAKILTGAERSDTGTLQLGGIESTFGSPREALNHGIALIPQELAYVPDLAVAENVMLNRLPSRKGVTTRKAIRSEALGVMQRAGLEVAVDRTMASLSLADRQIVEIVKALGRESKVLILDEPTAALTADESAKLYAILRELRQHGIGIIVISHHLDQISEHADRIDVFRDGERVFSASPRTTPNTTFIEQMLGAKSHVLEMRRKRSGGGERVLTVDSWNVDGRPGLSDVSFALHAGEVVGIYGIRGGGSELVAEGLGGRRPDITGTLTISGKELRIFRTPREAMSSGIAYLPPDRKNEGLVLPMSVSGSISMLIRRRLATAGLITARREDDLAAYWADRFHLKASSLRQSVGELSGGNQQKVLLASRLATEPSALVVHEPTRGVDIGARHEMHETLRALADDGVAVLVITSDVEEAVDVSDRLLVIRNGTLVAELGGDAITQEQVIRLAAA